MTLGKFTGLLIALVIAWTVRATIATDASHPSRPVGSQERGIGQAEARQMRNDEIGLTIFPRAKRQEAAQPAAQPPVEPVQPSEPFGPAADCNNNGTDDAVDLTPTLLPAPPSQFLTDANIDAQSDRRGNMRCDDFVLTANTPIAALDVEGREGGVSGDSFIVRFWSAYSVTDLNTDGIGDPGSYHPLAVEYSENVPAARVTRTLVSGSVFRWNIRLATPVTLAGSATGGGTTHFLEVVYVGPAANLWTWERNTTAVGSDVHVTQHLPETWINQTALNGLRFRLYSARSADFNTNGLPDECEDCNTNGTADSLEPGLADCNSNGVKDTCDIRLGILTDCNTNGVPDPCEAGDCNSNGVNDVCDIAAGAADCNTNRVPDLCELQGLSAPAFQQAAGYWPQLGAVSDGTFSGGGPFVRIDDFQLASARSLGGFSLFGFFLPSTAGGDGVTDTFTLRIWTNAPSNTPGVIEYSEAIPAVRVSRTLFLPNFFTGVWQYWLRLKQPINVSAGRHWLEIFYTGPAAGDWHWGYLEPSLLNMSHVSTVLPNESWTPAITDARVYASGYIAAADCNTNGLLDPCEVPGSDLNTDGLLDICADCNTNGTFDQTETAYRDCNTNGRADLCDLLPGGGSLDCNTNGTPDECETPDCNSNHIPDVCELATNDADSNGIPDDCSTAGCMNCPGDMNADGKIDGTDISGFVAVLLAGQPPTGQADCADINRDDQVNAADAELFRALLISTDGACAPRVSLSRSTLGAPTACTYELLAVAGSNVPPGWTTGSMQCIECTPASPGAGACPGPFVYFQLRPGDCVAIARRVTLDCGTGCTGAPIARFTP